MVEGFFILGYSAICMTIEKICVQIFIILFEWPQSWGYNILHTIFSYLTHIISRLMVVRCEAKKGQSNRQKQNARQTTVCLLHKQMFSSFDVIITVNMRQL